MLLLVFPVLVLLFLLVGQVLFPVQVLFLLLVRFVKEYLPSVLVLRSAFGFSEA